MVSWELEWLRQVSHPLGLDSELGLLSGQIRGNESPRLSRLCSDERVLTGLWLGILQQNVDLAQREGVFDPIESRLAHVLRNWPWYMFLGFLSW